MPPLAVPPLATLRALAPGHRFGVWGPRLLSALAANAHRVGQVLKHAIVALSHHTGIPVVIVAAAALVVSWRLARKAGRLAVELAVAAAAVGLATKMGWIVW